MTTLPVKISFDPATNQIRFTCGDGGPTHPELIIDLHEGSIKVFEPKNHDSSSNRLTGWRYFFHNL